MPGGFHAGFPKTHLAATHQSLVQLVEERRYRADLYYRLDVFPIFVPPLRERPDDIPDLLRHFVDHFAAKAKKQIDHIPEELTRALLSYSWPGNIRELQNFAERAVLLTTGNVLSPRTTEFTKRLPQQCPERARTLAEIERMSITEALRRTNWVIGGNMGAAANLGLPRTTLIARMRKHGITRELSREAIPFPAGFSAQQEMAATA